METPLNNLEQNPPQDPPSLKASILEQIERGSVSVTPKWRFTFKSILSAGGLLLGFAILLFAISFINFSLREAGVFALPEFGGEGIKVFFLSLPWFQIGLVVVVALALEFWLLRYAFAYRRPLLYSVFGVAACLTFGTVLVAVAHVHETVYEAVETANVPIARPFYDSFVDPDLPQVRRGKVADLEDDGFHLENRNGQVIEVKTTRETRVSPPMAIRVGELLVVFGQDEEGYMRAIGIKHVEPSHMIFIRMQTTVPQD